MKETDITARFDRYGRREDTLLAHILRTISPVEGKKYRESFDKRITELIIATPLALATFPWMLILAGAKKLEDGGGAIYMQERLSGDGPVRVAKIRCMKEDTDQDTEVNIRNAARYKAEDDPRNTRLGSFMRKYQLEELPQLWQVVIGQLSLIDIRVLPQYIFDFLERERPKTFGEWKRAYGEGKPGIISLNSVVSKEPKNARRRHHYDLLYSRKASLGLDLYILYRTALLLAKRAI